MASNLDSDNRRRDMDRLLGFERERKLVTPDYVTSIRASKSYRQVDILAMPTFAHEPLRDALRVPDGFTRVDYCGLTLCGLDGAVEQPFLVVQSAPGETLWQRCTRFDCFGRRFDDPACQPGMPYWHPLTAVGDSDAASMTADAASK